MSATSRELGNQQRPDACRSSHIIAHTRTSAQVTAALVEPLATGACTRAHAFLVIPASRKPTDPAHAYLDNPVAASAQDNAAHLVVEPLATFPRPQDLLRPHSAWKVLTIAGMLGSTTRRMRSLPSALARTAHSQTRRMTSWISALAKTTHLQMRRRSCCRRRQPHRPRRSGLQARLAPTRPKARRRAPQPRTAPQTRVSCCQWPLAARTLRERAGAGASPA